MGIRNPDLSWIARKKFPGCVMATRRISSPGSRRTPSATTPIIVHGLWNYAALGAWRALAKSETPYFVYAHGMLDPYFNKVHPVKAAAQANSLVVQRRPPHRQCPQCLLRDRRGARLARQSFWPFRCNEPVVAYGTQDVPGNARRRSRRFAPRFRKLTGRKFLLFLSRIHPKKGCDLLIEAFAKIAADNPALDLVMAGPDSVGWRKQA